MTYHPRPRAGRYFYSREKGGLRHRALYAIVQARKIFENREDTGRDHTIFSGSDPQVDKRGPEQLAVQAVGVAGRLLRNRATIRWTPAHQVADGNEVAGEWAKAVAKSVYLPVRQVWLSCPEASRRKRQRKRRNGSAPTSGESADTAPAP